MNGSKVSLRFYEIAICGWCKKKFPRRKSNHHGYLPAGVRGKNCLTCSKECSKKYSSPANCAKRREKNGSN